MRHVESLVAALELLVAECGIQFPDQGSNLGSLHWKSGVLASGLPGMSLKPLFVRFSVLYSKTWVEPYLQLKCQHESILKVQLIKQTQFCLTTVNSNANFFYFIHEVIMKDFIPVFPSSHSILKLCYFPPLTVLKIYSLTTALGLERMKIIDVLCSYPISVIFDLD